MFAAGHYPNDRTGGPDRWAGAALRCWWADTGPAAWVPFGVIWRARRANGIDGGDVVATELLAAGRKTGCVSGLCRLVPATKEKRPPGASGLLEMSCTGSYLNRR